MRRVSVFAGLSVAVVLWSACGGHAEPKQPLKDFMQVKLSHSQKVLEGLVREDYELIAKHSQEMSLLSLAETWQVLTTPEYVEFSRKFRHAADKLTDMAKKKNLDQATAAYNQMTTSCVECHKYVRQVQLAKDRK
jgi:cytochrome c556